MVWLGEKGEGNEQVQTSSYVINVTVMYSKGNIVNNTVITLCGGRWLLDLKSRSICNVSKC